VKLTELWRRMHNEEPYNLYALPHIISVIESRRVRCDGNVSRMGQMRNAYKVFVGKPEGWKPIGRPKRRWEDNIENI
jgi:hypothetical protein